MILYQEFDCYFVSEHMTFVVRVSSGFFSNVEK